MNKISFSLYILTNKVENIILTKIHINSKLINKEKKINKKYKS